ncbi:MAG TPA: TonB family protein [Thermodesulfovibrionales bacterium]|nr:TonB family protein [Thermodesulfovibrionales bacterium]
MFTLKRFFAYSVALHITFFILALTLISPVKNKKREEFFAKIISPEELLTPAPPIPAIPEIKPFLPSKPGGATSKLHIKPGSIVSKPPGKADTQTSSEQGPSYSQTPSSPAYPGQEKESIPETKGNSRKPDVPMPSLKEKLFDSNIIGDIAKKEIKKEENEERTFSFNVKELRYLAYLRRLKERIENIWIYPPDAATRGIYGDLVIKFTIKKNGSLGVAELVRTSGHKSLDDAALRALKEAEPFWPIPDEWGMEAYTIEGHFIYTIYGYYVR